MLATTTRHAPPSSLIDAFDGDDEWLSNFFDSPLLWQGMWFPTAEAAFQAGKTLDMNLRQEIANAHTPGQAKYLGRSLALRPRWNSQLRYQVMDEVLAAKFTVPDLAARLVGTGTALLVEGNRHHDDHWGDCACRRHRSRPGRNELGRALMRRRAQLNPAVAGRWTRVACTGHRPHKIPPRLRGWVQEELARVAAKLVAERGTEVGLSGLAQGSDLWWAQAAHAAGARVWAYSPCPDQDQRWTREWKNRRREVIELAEHAEHLGERYDVALLGARNTWLCRDADALVAVVDPSRGSGGTIAAMRQAVGRIPVIRIDLHSEQVRLMQPDPHRQII